jgi:S-DNA-T family DNA segregation ATPase FtsK/SpoIIIE
MARHKKLRSKHEEEDIKETRGLNPETKRGITSIFLLTAAAVIFLSFFDIAGSLGHAIDIGLAYLFGWNRFLVPVSFLFIAGSLLFPGKNRFTAWSTVGILFFFLSFNALLNLILVHRPQAPLSDISLAGGYLGEFLGNVLPSFTGYWGAFVIVCALLVVSLLLLFNTSISRLFSFHRPFTSLLCSLIHLGRKKEEPLWDEDEEESNEKMEEENETEEEEKKEEEEEPHKTFRANPVPSSSPEPEQVLLSSKKHKHVSIPLELLHHSNTKPNSGDIERNKEIIQKTLYQFGIDVEMGETSTGPTVTQYTLRPSQGVKLSRIVALQNDLALALAAHPIRIEAPIPKKSLVGIEVPNQRIATVTLREVLESEAFRRRRGNLSFPLGKDVSGQTHVVEIDKMPHLLVAGATGSGKSVCINTIIISLLYQNSPEDLRIILIDPKRVEMTAYEGVPHLLVPPIMKVEDTVNALKWTVREMERRLDTLSKFGARDINSYNARAEKQMPKIILAIDELADIMTASGREVEAAIVRIAQMARAVGIHLILATQRPSVDVITGLIKANIPARIAFAVASQTDSRTILDMSGAEKLLGRGDMLFTCAELSKPRRLQGAFVSEGEVESVVEHLKIKAPPDYNYAITEQSRSASMFGDNTEESDPLAEEAIQIILESGKASTSYLQRRMRIGYARAARLIDILEDMGVVGPGEGAKPREILVEEWPPGGDIKEGMPTTDDDHSEALGTQKEEMEEEQEKEEDVRTPPLKEESEGEETYEILEDDDYLEAQEGDYLDEEEKKS